LEAALKSSTGQFVVRFIADDTGQDLVEYAMLAAFVALATMAGLKVIENTLGNGYRRWDSNEQNLWTPPEP
jgi:Flp pilus assembly pilin Flp